MLRLPLLREKLQKYASCNETEDRILALLKNVASRSRHCSKVTSGFCVCTWIEKWKNIIKSD
jgi:hypothetical protein